MNEQKIENFFYELEDDLYVIKSSNFEDFRAVLSAKTSRIVDIKNRIPTTDQNNVESFLINNIKEYGHSSVADMAFCSVFHRGFGWVTAWLLEDDKLFAGQETSTRAVNIIKNDSRICYDVEQHTELSTIQLLHEEYTSIFNSINNSLTQKKVGYEFDYIRWSLPGTIRTGVTVVMSARSFIRHMQRLQTLSFVKRTVDKYLKGVCYTAPYIYKSMKDKKRSGFFHWNRIETKNFKECNEIEITLPENFTTNLQSIFEQYDNITRSCNKEMLQPLFDTLGLIKVTFLTSVAVARDFHRHRTGMPWFLKLIVENDQPIISPVYKIPEDLKQKVNQLLKLGYSKFKNRFEDMYLFPFGTLVEMTGYFTLPNLIYTAELRSTTAGCNFEQQRIGIIILNKIKEILGEKIANKLLLQ